MARPLRIEFPGALYHLTTRGNMRVDIYRVEADRKRFLELLEEAVDRFDWLCHAYCLMTNHYHLVIETPEPNLSRGMRQLNGVYAQAFHTRHGTGGHLFQGRFHTVLVEKDRHLLELARYLVLNPVRAGLVADPAEWAWSSYRATAGLEPVPPFLTVDDVLGLFGGQRARAADAYRRFVAEGTKLPSPWRQLTGGLVLGSDEFALDIRRRLADAGELARAKEIQRLGRPPLAELMADHRNWSRDEMAEQVQLAHETYGYRLGEIAAALGVHSSTVSRSLRRAEEKR